MRYFISELRYWVGRLFPVRAKWWMTRQLPWFVDFAAQFFQGIDPSWWHDFEFKSIYREIAPRSILDRKRAWVIYNLVMATDNLPGAIGEIGVYRGGSAKLILAARRSDRVFYGFDTFSGLPETEKSRDPYWSAGEMADTTIEEVRQFLGTDSVHLIQGSFPGSATRLPDNVQFSFVHLDVDIYPSTLESLAWLYDRMTPSGIILLDDYGFLSCPGVREAVDEFFTDKPVHPVYLPTGQCMILMNPA